MDDSRLHQLVAQYCKQYFPDITPPFIRYADLSFLGGQFRLETTYQGNFYWDTGIIEIGAGMLDRDLEDTVLHELVHAWVWATGKRTDENGGHNYAFIHKAVGLDLDLTSTFESYPETKKLYFKAQEAWNVEMAEIYQKLDSLERRAKARGF